MTSYEYLLKLSRREAPLTSKLDITNFESFGATPCGTQLCADLAFDIDRYLRERGDARVKDWARLALARVMYENGIDAFVHPENTVPTPRILGPNVGSISLDGITPFFQIPRIVVPAGTTDVIYEPQYALSADRTDYVPVLPDDVPKTRLEHPLPISLAFFAGPGDEPVLIKVGTAYESATHHRFAPPDFGPVTGRRLSDVHAE